MSQAPKGLADERSRQTRAVALPHARALPRLTQDPRPRHTASAAARADARSGALQRRDGDALRHLGPYTDPAAEIDVRRGLPDLRTSWIEARGDTELYTGRERKALDDGTKHEEREAQRIAALRAEAAALQRQPRRAKAGANVTQMHYARRGIVTPEMEFVAIRENGKREWMAEYLADTRARPNACAATPWARRFPSSSRPSSCATRWRGAAPSSRPTSTTPRSSRWRSAATSW